MALAQSDRAVTNAPSTPLIALDAAVVDTETTGLDARSARVVQIGAVLLQAGSLDGAPTFTRLVNPGVPIPAASAAIHGISDEQVREAPSFADAAAEFEAFVGNRVLIGHTIGYDLAVLRREYELAGRPWPRPRALDVRILAEVAQPTLAQYDLERLCRWLEIEIEGRHTALGDAIAAARIFTALLPALRDRGVRTLAQAESASRELADRQAQAIGGLASLDQPAAGVRRSPLARIDSFAYRHRVRDVMSAPPAVAPATLSVREAIHLLLEKKISSVFVDDGSGDFGIVTERDLLRAVDVPDGGAGTSLGSIMNRPLHWVGEDDFLYRAIGRIERLGFRHLAVRNARGELAGAVTPRNLLRERATTAIVLGDSIDSATDDAALAQAWARLPQVAGSLIADGTDKRAIAAVVSSEICALTRRAAELAEIRMAQEGKGSPPARYAVLVLGSAGRTESLLAADQDNAIVFEQGEPGGPEDKWFEALAVHMTAILDGAGVPYCKGGVMASKPEWRRSLAGWKSTIDGWVRRQRPNDLLNVDIFFDGVPVHGTTMLGETVWDYAYEVGKGNAAFLKLLTELARDWRPPLTMFGNIRTDSNGRVDLKKGGLMPLFTCARVLAIRHGVPARSTPERYRGVSERGIGSPRDIDAIIEAHRHLLGLMLDQQLIDAEKGIRLTPNVDLGRLGKDGREKLRSALDRVSTAIDLVGEGRL